MPQIVTKEEMQHLLTRKREVIEEWRTLRPRLPEPVPRPPASEEEIRTFEQRLGIALPWSYRLFLSIHNGFSNWGPEFDLLSIEEMEGGKDSKRVVTYKEEAWEVGDSLGVSGLVIGLHRWKGQADILDTSSRDAEGECPVVSCEILEMARYSNFHEYVKEMVDITQELVAEEKQELQKE